MDGHGRGKSFRCSSLAHDYVPENTDVSTKVVSDKPVICERAMYGPGFSWAHESLGYVERIPEASEDTKVLSAGSREKIASLAPDSISGRVTDAISQQGVQGVSVHVFDSSCGATVGYTQTTADGSYEFRGLAPGEYVVQFVPHEGPYRSEYYQDKQNREEADIVTVAEGVPATGIDALLEAGGFISGRVTSLSEPDGVYWVSVNVFDTYGQWWGITHTDEQGRYTTPVLPPGRYKVRFTARGDYLPQWYQAKVSFEEADEVEVVSGTTTQNIDAVLEENASISGRVTSASQPEGVAGLHVYAYRSTDSELWVRYAVTGADGSYTLDELHPGEYKVVFSPNSGMNYAEEWYDNKPDFDSADVVQLASGEDRTGVDAVLETGGTISGRVISRSNPEGLEGIGVYAYTPEGDYARAALTDAEGRYTLPSLNTGEYKLYFEPGSHPYKDEWYQDKHDLDSADPVAVVTGEETSLADVELSECGSISGRVTSLSEPEGIGGIQVTLRFSSGEEYGWIYETTFTR